MDEEIKKALGHTKEGYIFLVSTIIAGIGVIFGPRTVYVGTILFLTGMLGLLVTIYMNAVEKEEAWKKAIGITIKLIVIIVLGLLGGVFILI